jgi:predicted ArsR family transcriptional regulator
MPDRAADRLLYALKSRGPQTACELAEVLKVTDVAVRQTAERLALAGLVTHDDRRVGVGRPKRHWLLTEAGHQRFPDRHAALTLDLIEATATVFGPEGLDRLIAHREGQMLAQYGAATAGLPLRQRIEKLAELRSAEGYMAEVVEDEEGFLLVENHCPICVAATRCQNFCRSELTIFAAVLGPDVSIERIDHIVAGARRCAYRIRAVAAAA